MLVKSSYKITETILKLVLVAKNSQIITSPTKLCIEEVYQEMFRQNAHFVI